MKRQNLAALAAAATSLALVPSAAVGADPGDRKVALNNSGPAAMSDHGKVRMGAAATQSAGMSLALQVPMRNAAELERRLAQGTTISPAEFQKRYAPTPAQMNRAAAWARSKGLSVSSVDRNGGSVYVSGQVRKVNSAFGVQMKRATLGKVRGMTADRTPQVAATSGISGVSGLSTLHRMRPMNDSTPMAKKRSTLRPGKKMTSGAMRPRATATATGSQDCAEYWGEKLYPSAKKWSQQSNYICGYIPQDLARMYGTVNTKLAPKLGILLWGGEPNMKAITNEYMTAAKFPLLQNYSATIEPPTAGMADCDPEGVKGEHALDVQSSHSIAPSASIVYRGAGSCYDPDLTKSLSTMISQRQVSTISMSFGMGDDAGMTTADKEAWDRPFRLAGMTGISVFASSGDWGNNSTKNENGAAGVGYPASSSYVTSVGGTSVGMTRTGGQPVVAGWETREYLQPNPASTAGITDVTMQNLPISGAGGGASKVNTQPAWQKGVVTGSSSQRMVPDVSAVGDPYTGYMIKVSAGQQGYTAIGGTSLSSPIVAALVGASKSLNGTKVGFAAPFIYKMRATSGIKDVNFAGKSGVYYPGEKANLAGFDAKPENLVTTAGWDNVTGVGTPAGWSFLTGFGK